MGGVGGSPASGNGSSSSSGICTRLIDREGEGVFVDETESTSEARIIVGIIMPQTISARQINILSIKKLLAIILNKVRFTQMHNFTLVCVIQQQQLLSTNYYVKRTNVAANQNNNITQSCLTT